MITQRSQYRVSDFAIRTIRELRSTSGSLELLITPRDFCFFVSPGSSSYMVTALVPACQRRCDREGSRLSRSASRSPPESNPSSGPGCFRVSSFALAIWAEYCCGCAQMLDWSSWRGRGCERAVGVDRWRCSRRFSPPEHRLWLSHDEMSTRHKDPIR